MQGLKDKNFDPDELLEEQHSWENKHSEDQPQPAKN
jgi:phospholipid-binding lipoprotein MlaA